MRHIESLDSVKAFYLDRKEIIEHLKKISYSALHEFPEIYQIRLIGSLANQTATGLSDVDLWIIVNEYKVQHPIERLKPYFFYFVDKVFLSLDIIVTLKDDLYKEIHKKMMQESILLAEESNV